jgi:hypothetical protein
MFFHRRNPGKSNQHSPKNRFLPAIERLESRDTPTAPFLSQIVRYSPPEQSTNSPAVSFQAVFSQDMKQSTINSTNTFMALVNSGTNISFGSIQNVYALTPSTYIVQVGNLPDSGTLSLALNPLNQAQNTNNESVDINVTPSPNETYTLLAKPTPLTVINSVNIFPSPPDAGSPAAIFQIQFNKPINPDSISTSDFQFVKNISTENLQGSIVSASVDPLDQTTINVNVGKLVGKGSFHVEIPSTSTIMDTENQQFQGSYSAPSYIVNRTPPSGAPTTFSLSTIGSLPIVEIRYQPNTPNGPATIKTIQPFDSAFKGGVKTATGDYNGDGYMDIIATAADGGQGHIVVFDGISLNVIASFYAYPGYQGAVNIASGDLSGLGQDDIVVGVAGPGPSHVTAFRFGQEAGKVTNTAVTNFYAYPGYLGGITVAAGDMTGDGKADISTGTMGGVTPHVVIFELNSAPPASPPTAWRSFYAFDPQYFGVVNLATGDFNGDLVDELITSSGPGAASTILVFQMNNNPTPEVYRSFLPFGGRDLGGVTVGTGDWNKDGILDVIAGAQSGPKPLVNVFNIQDPVVPKLIDELFAFGGTLQGGVSIG